MTRVLLVEDDDTHRLYAEVVLRRHGYDIVPAVSGAAALEVARRALFDVILLDLGLPDVDGIEVCRRLRALTSAPIIFLSGRSDDAAKVLGLDAGADDFMSKPFSVAELTARIRAVLRRRSPGGAGNAVRLEAGGIVLDPDTHKVSSHGEEVVLTLKEFELLQMLLSEAGRVVTRQRLLDALWGPNFFGDANVLEVHISQLRRKLARASSHPPPIQTIRGVGYCFSEPSIAEEDPR